ncbi:MAG: NAD(+) synthase, partial [Planctomycetaceae bacterium]|nr:NAD(+) synthase [Planctomycetaceae bacterium]
MRRLRIAGAILNQTPLDWDGNLARIRAAISDARAAGAAVLCLPEMCITGYGCEDMFLSPHVWKTAWSGLQEIVTLTAGMVVTVGLPLYVTNGVYNVACVIADQRIAGFVAKQHLAGDGLHYEPRWFRAWPAEVTSEYCHGDDSWPLGDLMFEVDGIRFGFEICEDAWVAGRPGNRMAECGVDVILNPSASHFAFGKHEIRKRFVLEGSRCFGVSYVYANLVGNESGRAIYDGGTLIASGGELIAEGPRFSFRQQLVTVADVDIDLTRARRAGIHSMPTDHGDDVHERIVRIPGSLHSPADKAQRSQPTTSSAVSPTPHKTDEFTLAVSLALFDYMRKSRSNGFVVSMSGGADSSAIACLIGCMIHRGLKELGHAEFCRHLAYIPAIRQSTTAESVAAQLFVGAYQATRNSSEITRHAAESVTRAVGGTYYELNVDAIVQQYHSVIEQAIGRPLSWDTDDITLQNIQARSRAPGIWMLANLRNALLLATSNRSEAAVGYATMDGDTSGGLSPIAGIDKAFLREWLKVMETTGSGDCPPLAALSFVNEQQPTAELRPAEFAQTDEGDLMPYPVLDQIERLAIRDKMSPAEVLTVLQEQRPQDSQEQLKQWVLRFFRLWSRNQWKRERYAPSFHVDDKNLDPKTWCRFPILSGGFQRELNLLTEDSQGLSP